MTKALIKAMRPKQWAKNIFLTAGLVFSRQLTNMNAISNTALAIILFSLLASAVYLINDIGDVEADRKHPKKKNRPIASGALKESSARIAVIILVIIVFSGAYLLSKSFLVVCVFYFILNLSYSKWIKHIPLLDLLVLASFYIIRVVAGISVIEVQHFSPWLYVATSFVALFMGIGKRRAELVMAQEKGISSRKVLESYTLPFLDQLTTIVLTITIVTYSLYTFSAPNLPDNNIMMITIPFVIYGIFRYLYLVQVEGHGEAPDEIVLSDRPFQINIIMWGITVFLIFYIY
ncbi:MAG: decaprenyl-phosphate phosphoribosyltransferase [Chloroflexota bacterium]